MNTNYVIAVSLLFIIGNVATFFELVGLHWYEIQREHLFSDMMMIPFITTCLIPLSWFLAQYFTNCRFHVQACSIPLNIAVQLLVQTKGMLYPLQTVFSAYFFYIAASTIQKKHQVGIYHLAVSFFFAQSLNVVSYYVNSNKYGNFTDDWAPSIMIIIPSLCSSFAVCGVYFLRSSPPSWATPLSISTIIIQLGISMEMLSTSRWYIPFVGLSSSGLLYIWALYSLPYFSAEK